MGWPATDDGIAALLKVVDAAGCNNELPSETDAFAFDLIARFRLGDGKAIEPINAEWRPEPMASAASA